LTNQEVNLVTKIKVRKLDKIEATHKVPSKA
jgi:hypothetical protein